jgi:hypothetical protein
MDADKPVRRREGVSPRAPHGSPSETYLPVVFVSVPAGVVAAGFFIM